jgi:adenosylhomocysteine nucleosidase
MRADFRSAAPGGSAASIDSLTGAGREAAAIAVIAALDSERKCLRPASGPAAAGISILQSGPGPARAAAAARGALSSGAAGLVSWGFAAGLAPGLAPGTLLLPVRVLGPEGAHAADPAWRAALLGALGDAFTVSDADLLTVDALLATPNDKARAARVSGAAAADMESALIAAASRRAGVPFVALRAVLDAAGDALPPDADRWIDAAGNRRHTPLLGAVLKPWHWETLIALAARHRKARETLIAAADRLLPLRFAWSGPSEPAR